MESFDALISRCISDGVPRSRDKIEKILSSILMYLETDNIIEGITKNSKNKLEISWASLNKVLFLCSDSFFDAIRKANSNGWWKTPMNKKILETLTKLLRIALESCVKSNCRFDVNKFVGHIFTVSSLFFDSYFDLVQRFTGIFFFNSLINKDTSIITELDKDVLNKSIRLLNDFMRKIENPDDQKLVFLLRLNLSFYRKIVHIKHPDVNMVLDVLKSIKDHSLLSTSLEMSGLICGLINHLYFCNGAECSISLSCFSISFSIESIIKIWIDNRKNCPINDESKINESSDEIKNSRIEILKLWINIYAVVGNHRHYFDQNDNCQTWLRYLIDCLHDELTYTFEKAKFVNLDRCYPNPVFCELFVKLLLHKEIIKNNNELSQMNRLQAVVKVLMDNLESDSASVVMVSLKIFEKSMDIVGFFPTILSFRTQLLNSHLNLLKRYSSTIVLISCCLNNIKEFINNKFDSEEYQWNNIFDVLFKCYTSDLPNIFQSQLSQILSLIIDKNSFCFLGTNFWPKLCQLPVSDASIDLATNAILKLNVSRSYRFLLDSETIDILISWICSINDSLISTSKLFSLVSAMICRRHFRSGVYCELVASYDEHCNSLDLMKFSEYLEFISLNQPFVYKPYLTASNISFVLPNFSLLTVSGKKIFKKLLSEDNSSPILFVLIIRFLSLSILEENEVERTSSIDLLVKYLYKTIDFLKANLSNSNFLRSVYYIKWIDLIRITKLKHSPLFEDKIREILKVFQTVLMEEIEPVLKNVLSGIEDRDISMRIDGLFNLVCCQDKVDENVHQLVDFFLQFGNDILLQHVHVWTVVMSNIKLYHLSLPLSIFTQILSLLKKSCKIFNNQVQSLNVTLSFGLRTIEFVIATKNIDEDTKIKYGNFFYEIGNLLFVIADKNYSTVEMIHYQLSEWMAMLFYLFYQNDNSKEKSWQIVRKIVELYQSRSNLKLRLAANVFVDSIRRYFDVNEFEDVIFTIRKYWLDVSISSVETPDELWSNGLFQFDRYVCETASFLQTWVPITLTSTNPFFIGKTLLPFIDKMIPNNKYKPKIILKFLEILHTNSKKRMEFSCFIKDILQFFSFGWIKLIYSCDRNILVPECIRPAIFVKTFINDIIWGFITNDLSVEFFDEFLPSHTQIEPQNMLQQCFPSFAARIVFYESCSIDFDSAERVFDFFASRNVSYLQCNNSIPTTIVHILRFLVDQNEDFDCLIALFHKCVSRFFLKFLNSESNLDEWLSNNSNNLTELIVSLINNEEISHLFWKIWCLFLKAVLNCDRFWYHNVDFNIFLLIIRHLTVFTKYIDSNCQTFLHLLLDLVNHAAKIVSSGDLIIHIFWQQQIVYALSFHWERVSKFSDVVGLIVKTITSKATLNFINPYVFISSGLSDMESIKDLSLNRDPILTLEIIIRALDKFGLQAFLYHGAYLDDFCRDLFDALNLTIIDPKIGIMIRKITDFLYSCLANFDNLAFLKACLNRKSLINFLMYLRLLLPQIPTMDLSCARKNGTDFELEFVKDLLMHFLYDFTLSWDFYQTMRMITKIKTFSPVNDHFFVQILNGFSSSDFFAQGFEYKFDFSLAIQSINDLSLDLASKKSYFIKSICVKSDLTVFNNCSPSVYDLPLIQNEYLPVIVASLKLSESEKVQLIRSFNDILSKDDLYLSSIVVRCFMTTFYFENYQILSNNKNNWGDIDLLAAADAAYKLKMYTLALMFLERYWILNVDVTLKCSMVNLYKQCYDSLMCQEELMANQFLFENSDYEDQFGFLMNSGHFALLKNILQEDIERNKENVDGVKLNALWKLSRWNDNEAFERTLDRNAHLNDIILYDSLFLKSQDSVEVFIENLGLKCIQCWDQEETVADLFQYICLSAQSDRLNTILDTMIMISNKFNIKTLDSAIHWALLKSTKNDNSSQNVGRMSLMFCDAAVRCNKIGYIHLIIDLLSKSVGFNNNEVKCDGVSITFRMVEVMKFRSKSDIRKSIVLLENLVSDCQDHLINCRKKCSAVKEIYFRAISDFCAINQTHAIYNPSYIKSSILDPAVNNQTSDALTIFDSKLLDTLANFSYQQFSHINEYMRSTEYQSRLKLVTDSKRNVKCLQESGDNSKLTRILKQQVTYDESDFNILHQDREAFLLSAVLSCFRCLRIGDEYNMKIFQLLSMWLKNETNQKLNELMEDVIGKIETYKFIALLPQLMARLSNVGDKVFQRNLFNLIEKVVTDHPYHSLYDLFAIINSNKDSCFTAQKRMPKKRKVDPVADVSDGRILISRNLIEKLRKGQRSHILNSIEMLTDAYIELANADFSQWKTKLDEKISLPENYAITKIKQPSHLHIPTISLSIDKSRQYTERMLITIIKFDQTFLLKGGINLPKVVWCHGSDGVARRQLVKGKDDLRQDSVMQQVFDVVNSLIVKTETLLLTDANQKVRQISHYTYPWSNRVKIRTYKVIPTSKLSGVIEWCHGTVSIGDWLTDEKTGAHQRYRPFDMSPQECRRKLHFVKDRSLNDRITTFKKIISTIQPVFGHFLLENFPDPRDWFVARKIYTDSLALNSITGFILGLGDRHVQNILLDTNSAELIHIDFGIAFDQGRLLPTPEVVPFRLTRDMVHALGPFGVEGRFKSTCCSILNVLRDQRDIIITLVEVLLHDPLHSWSLTATQARVLQENRMVDNTESSVLGNVQNRLMENVDQEAMKSQDLNQVAERILLELTRKLSGVVDNYSLTVEGHVNYLVQTATDMDNLARMFGGWQAYL